MPAVRTGISPSNPRQHERMQSVASARPHRAQATSSQAATPRGQKALEPWGIAPMTERIREFLRKRNDEGPCLVVDLDVVRDNYNAFAKALPDTRVFYAVKANPAPEVLALAGQARLLLRHRLDPRDRDGARGRRDARPHLLWQHDQEGARHRARLRARRSPLRGRLQGRGREGRPRGARQPRVLPHPLRLRRRRMAAVAQVRLRAGHGRRRAGARPQGGSGAASASRSMSARSSATSMPGTARSLRRRRCSRNAASAA